MPDTEALSSFDALCTEEHEWRFSTTDFNEMQRHAREVVGAAVKLFRDSHAFVGDQIETIGTHGPMGDSLPHQDTELRILVHRSTL